MTVHTVNARHQAIAGWLTRFGFKPGMEVYEIGCGDGPVTELIAETAGRVVAVDVDPFRALAATERLAGYPNVTVLAADATEYKPPGMFDVVVIPDALEHVPGERHPTLFANITDCLRDDGFVLLHMPSPLYLRWLHEHHPDLLQQPCDEPVYTRDLLAAAEPAGLHLRHLETYDIWTANGEYQAIVLVPLVSAYRFVVR